jgi:hypothetical protein
MTTGSHASRASILQDVGLLKSFYKQRKRPLLTRFATEQADSVWSFAPDGGWFFAAL